MQLSRTADYRAGQAKRFLLYTTLLGLFAFCWRREMLRKAFLPWAGVMVSAEWIALGVAGGRADLAHLVVGLMGPPRWWPQRGTARGALASSLLLAVFLSCVLIREHSLFLTGGDPRPEGRLIVPKFARKNAHQEACRLLSAASVRITECSWINTKIALPIFMGLGTPRAWGLV